MDSFQPVGLMPHRLLLADDSVTIQRVIELTFADEDIQVTAVGDGQQAIDRIAADPPDIVLADVGMPERDGYEVAAFIKDRPDLAHIPVLLLTGAFEPVDEARARQVRCDGVLAKPFEPQLLIARVKELLRRGHDAPPADRSPAPAADARAADDSSDDTNPIPLPPSADDEDLALDAHALLEGAPSPVSTPEAEMSLDDYFDRLDQAFANLAGTGGAREAATRTSADPSWAPPPPPSGSWPAAHGAETDLTGAWNAPAAADLPTPPFPARAQTVPVADAFATLLEAEASGGAQPADSEGFGMLNMPPTVSDQTVEEIVRRVIERLGDRHVRDLVAQTVSAIAERLVREEIERLKAAAASR